MREQAALGTIIKRIVEVAAPGERFPPDDPREWLNRARSNLASAKNQIPDAWLSRACQ